MNRKHLISFIFILLISNCATSQQQCLNDFKIKIVRVAGFQSGSEFVTFYQKLVNILDKGNVQNFINLHSFKIKINNSNGEVYYNNIKDIVQKYKTIFLDDIVSSLSKNKICESFINWQGIMINNGLIWITPVVESEKEYYLITINK